MVDIYLLWVNGGDPVWSKKRDEIAKKEKLNITEKYSESRFIEHDELRWALRSIERFAPWVHKIHLLTDRQYPSWMKREHLKIHFVDHDTLFYPGFHSYNSIAMQMAVARVSGISRRTILMDDDYMFMNHVSISDFFDEMNRTVIRGFIKATEYNFSDDMSHKKKCSSLVTSSIFNYGSMLAHRVVYVIFKKTTNIFFSHVHFPIDILILNNITYSIGVEKTLHHPFRMCGDIQMQNLYLSFSHAIGRTVLDESSKFVITKGNQFANLMSLPELPKLVCINIYNESFYKNFVSMLFNKKSSFEW